VIPVYFIAALVIPKEPTHYNPFGPGPGAPGGPFDGPYSGRPEHGHGPHANGGHGPYGRQPNYNPNFEKNNAYSAPDSGLDAMMKDIEKKALQKK